MALAAGQTNTEYELKSYREPSGRTGEVAVAMVNPDGTAINSPYVGTQTTLQNSATATGNGTALTLSHQDFITVDIRGITSASVTFEASFDNSNWDAVYGLRGGSYTLASNVADNGTYIVNVSGYNYFRARIATYTSGTIIILAQAYNGSGFQTSFNYMMNTLSGEDTTNGLIRIQEKKVVSPTGAPLTSSSLYGDVDVSAKSSAGNVYAIVATNLNAAVRYFQLHDKASAPANPNVPYKGYSFPMVQNQTIVLGEETFGTLGEYFPTGIAWGFSTTAATFTAATTTDHAGIVRYL